MILTTTDQPYDVIAQAPFARWDGPGGSKLYLVQTMEQWKAFYSLLMQRKLVACDTETDGFEWFKGKRIVGMSFGWNETHFYVPVRHEDSYLDGKQIAQLDMDDIREDLQKFFAQKDVLTIWHNFKFDRHMYLNDGIEIKTPFHDTRILWQLHDENAPGALKVIASGWRDTMQQWHEGLVGEGANADEKALDEWRADEARARRSAFSTFLKAEADKVKAEPQYQKFSTVSLKKYLGDTVFTTHPLYGVSKDDIHYGFIPIPMMVRYAALDTFLTWTIYHKIVRTIKDDKQVFGIYVNELKLCKALFDAERRGVQVDAEELRQAGQTLTAESLELEMNIKATLNAPDINLAATQQLAKALQDHGVPLTKKTKTGIKLDKILLDKLSRDYAVIQDILSYRQKKKLISTYVEGILGKLTDEDILHCSFNQNVATGRMSSGNPNLQNIPARDKTVRKAFVVPNDDYVFIFADYSQIEVRLTAHFSGDALLLDAYKKNQDIHTRTACEMFGYDYDEAVEALHDENNPLFKEIKEKRNVAKRLNFGIIYGVGAPGLSEQIGMPSDFLAKFNQNFPSDQPGYKEALNAAWVQHCQNFIDNYFAKYIGVKRFINSSNRYIKQHKQIRNHFGRIRHLPFIDAVRITGQDKFKFMYGRALRQGTNFVIQGTAADLFKIAVVRVHDVLKGTKSYMVSYVHDEIQIYLHKSELHLLKQIKHVMEDFPEFSVPIVVDIEWSKDSWANKKELQV